MHFVVVAAAGVLALELLVRDTWLNRALGQRSIVAIGVWKAVVVCCWVPLPCRVHIDFGRIFGL